MSIDHFEQFSFNNTILEVIKKLHFKNPTDIQVKTFKPILEGDSVIGSSHTGSGKTHAYLLPIFNQLHADKNEVQAVITAPTRELAIQIYEEVKKIITYANKEDIWTARLLIGGTDKQRNIKQLKDPPQIIVGTPGRILDLVNEGALSIYSASSFIVDEADLMLDLGFINEIDQLLIRCQEDIQIIAFSATIPKRLENFFKKYLQNPHYVHLDDQLSPATLEHQLLLLRHRDRGELVFELSHIFQPYLAIIFTNGKEQANSLAHTLQGKGLKVGLLHGGLSQRERKRTLKDIQDLRFQYIVATDLASRGIDIKGVSHVINAELPKEEEFYIHRVGRTARAGMEGTAISIYNEEDDSSLISRLENKGFQFTYVDIKNKELVESQPWNYRERRKKTTTDIEAEAWKRVQKPKKVKPNYRKKMKLQQQKIKRDLLKKQRRKK